MHSFKENFNAIKTESLNVSCNLIDIIASDKKDIEQHGNVDSIVIYKLVLFSLFRKTIVKELAVDYLKIELYFNSSEKSFLSKQGYPRYKKSTLQEAITLFKEVEQTV